MVSMRSIIKVFFILKGERNLQLYFIHDLLAMKKGSNHFLSTKNLRKMQIISKFEEVIIIKVMRISTTIIFGIVYGGYCIIAYMIQDYHFSLIILLIWFLILMLWAWNITSVIAFTYGIIFFVIYYLKLRFKQLHLKPDQAIHIYLLNDLMLSHHNLTIMTYNYNKFFNFLMGINQYCTTFALSLLFYISIYGNGDIYFRSANLMVAIIGSVLVFLATRASANLSLEAHRLYVPINSLNAGYKMPLNIKWKVRI